MPPSSCLLDGNKILWFSEWTLHRYHPCKIIYTVILRIISAEKGRISEWRFFAGCLQKIGGKKESLTTLKSWIIPSIFWDFTWGVLRRCVLHYWLTVCVYGTLLSLDLCMFSPQTNRVGNWQMQGVKYWLCVRVCVRAKWSCASVSACVCACFWLPSWFHLSVLPRRHKPLPSASCSKFLCVPNKRQEVEFKSKFFHHHTGI